VFLVDGLPVPVGIPTIDAIHLRQRVLLMDFDKRVFSSQKVGQQWPDSVGSKVFVDLSEGRRRGTAKRGVSRRDATHTAGH